MKKTLFFFAALAAMVSCSKDKIDNSFASETFSVSFTADAPKEAVVKTTLVDAADPALKYVHWTKGDAVKVLFFPNHTNTNSFSAPDGEFVSYFESATSAKANFRNSSWSWGFGTDVVSNRLKAKGIAVYPSSAVAESSKISGSGSACDTQLWFELPETQDAINGNIKSGLNFSYAEVDRDAFVQTVGGVSELSLSFNNACALIRLTMPAALEKDVLSVTLTSNSDAVLTGKSEVGMNYYKDEVLSPFTMVADPSLSHPSVTIANQDGTPLAAGAVYYAVVWPGTHPDGLTISFNAADGSVATVGPTSAVTLSASAIKPYKITSTLNFEEEKKDYSYVYSDGTQGDDIKSDIVGVIIYHGNPKEAFNDSQLPDEYCNGLAISVSSRKCAWNSSQIGSIPSSVKVSGATSAIADFSMGGYTATKAFGSNNYTVFDNGTAPAGTSGWYLGAANEWKYILNNRETINQLLEGVGDKINPTTKSEAFWLPYFYSTRAAIVYISGGAPYFYYEQYYYYPTYPSYCYNARPIFAF